MNPTRPVALLVLSALAACSSARSTPSAGPAGAAPIESIALPPPGGPVAPTRRLRRLSSREYDNVVRDLLGDASRPAARFVVDAYQNGYDNGSAGLAVQSDQVADYQTAAEALAERAVKHRLERLVGACSPDARGPAACADAFTSGFAARAYRRPLDELERQTLREVFDAELAAGSSGRRAIQTMLEVVLQSPQFLYREELGPRDAEGGAVELTSFEVATQLSFLLTGSLPDDTLWAAASEGRLRTRADRAREAARALATPGARDALRAFLHRWLATDRLGSVSKDLTVYPAFDTGTLASMSAELDSLYDAVAWSERGSLRELFTTTSAFVDPKLAALYGVAPVGPGLEPVALDSGTRAGVMTRAGFLTAHSDADSSGPVPRGVFVLGALLCAAPPPPPADIPAVAPPGDPEVQALTTRQRFEAHLTRPACAGCHARIDGIGFGFEQFDGLGAFRTTEKGAPVDASGNVISDGDIAGPFVGVSELSTRLSGSRALRDCYVRNAYRYAMGQIEPASDDLAWLRDGFTSDARLADVLLAIIDDPMFTARTFEPQGT